MNQPVDEQRIVRSIADRTIGGKTGISLGTVHGSRIPENVKVYLHSEVATSLAHGLTASAGMAKVGGHLTEVLASAAAFEYRFDRDEYFIVLERAVTTLVGYLTRPRLELERALFGIRNSVSREEAERRLGGFSDYAYLPSLIRRLMRNGQHGEITREWFRKIVERLDDQVVARHSGIELVRLSEPIFRFLLFGSDPADGKIPRRVLRDFYSEKPLHDFWQKIEESLGGEESVSFPGFLAIAENVERGTEVASANSGLGEPVHDDLKKPSGDETGVGGEAGTPGAVVPGPYQYPALLSVISPEEERKFVRYLFENDEAYYRAVVTSLDEMPSWKDAALYLSQFYQTNDLDPFADDVVLFTDAVYRRYDRDVQA